MDAFVQFCEPTFPILIAYFIENLFQDILFILELKFLKFSKNRQESVEVDSQVSLLYEAWRIISFKSFSKAVKPMRRYSRHIQLIVGFT